MKKIKFDKKLQLKKETIANLNARQMSNIQGGSYSSTDCYSPKYGCNQSLTLGCTQYVACGGCPTIATTTTDTNTMG